MKSFYIETYGVFLGMARPVMGGWLIQPTAGRAAFWTWAYGGVRETLEDLFNDEVHQLRSLGAEY